ncbi:MAG: HNH endonuclease [Candidatus Nealsonbacteria bacterium]|nr:HNH endonuclease [Candidatus Nealsonbacteria bacterium]
MAWKNTILQVGENHPNWAGGESASRGILERSNKKMMCVHCGTTDRRVLMVHHKDINRKNNKIKNLIWLCQNCHHLTHYYSIKI